MYIIVRAYSFLFDVPICVFNNLSVLWKAIDFELNPITAIGSLLSFTAVFKICLL